MISMMREDNFRQGDNIIQLGEISDKLFFITKGKIGIFVNTNGTEYYQGHI